MNLIDAIEKEHMKTEIPKFAVGDQVNVSIKIKEGEKERTQVFSGLVIAKNGGGIQETFTVRRIVQGEGVERVFPVHSPKVLGVTVKKSGKVRRAKLYYMRDRTSKGTRLKERRTDKDTKRS